MPKLCSALGGRPNRGAICAVVLIPSWEQPVVGNLSDELGAFWELVIGSDASAGSLGIGWEPRSQKISLGAQIGIMLYEIPRAEPCPSAGKFCLHCLKVKPYYTWYMVRK